MNEFWHGLEADEPPPPEHPPIPEVREHLLELARSLRADTISKGEAAHRIDRFEAWLWRRKAIRRAPKDSLPVTPKMASRIRALATEHPDWTEQHLAAEVGVKNQGRVSEVLAGFRR